MGIGILDWSHLFSEKIVIEVIQGYLVWKAQ
jgi:hypothetical protein